MVRIVAMADTHGFHEDLRVPDGDILIHAGDLTGRGTLRELASAHVYLASLPHEHKVVIAGNHDFCLQQDPRQARALLTGVTYLEDEKIELCGLNLYGSPWQPWFFDWAFNLQRGEPLREVWRKIPADTDVLITHGPPAGFGDLTHNGDRAGCVDLLERVRQVRPRLHLFGHIHEARGQWEEEGIILANVSAGYSSESPVVFDL